MPVRPSLPPGASVVRRDRLHLLVGTDPGVLVPDRPGLVDLLRLVDGVRDVQQLGALLGSTDDEGERGPARDQEPAADLPVRRVVAELLARGALVDASQVPTARLGVAVRTDVASRILAASVRTAVDDLGLRGVGSSGPGALVHVSAGEPPRSAMRGAVEDGLAHLLVRTTGSGALVGPFVVPGLSPCLGCLDLGRGDADPTWPAVVAQLEGPPIATGPPEQDPAHRWSVAALVAQELRALAVGRRPRSVSTVLRVGPDGSTSPSHQLAFHHRCGCWLLGRA